MKKSLFILLFMLSNLFASIGSVTLLEGEAFVKRDGKSLKLNLGDSVENHDFIETKENSKAKITFIDDTVITIGKNSSLNVDEYSFSNNHNDVKTEFSVTKGTFHTITGQIGKINPSKFKLKTKNATMGIRGTEFYGDENKVLCTSGAISVFSNGVTVDVKAGFIVNVFEDKVPSKAVKFKAEQFDEINNKLNTSSNNNIINNDKNSTNTENSNKTSSESSNSSTNNENNATTTSNSVSSKQTVKEDLSTNAQNNNFSPNTLSTKSIDEPQVGLSDSFEGFNTTLVLAENNTVQSIDLYKFDQITQNFTQEEKKEENYTEIKNELNSSDNDQASQNQASQNQASQNQASQNQASQNQASQNQASQNQASQNQASQNQASQIPNIGNNTSIPKLVPESYIRNLMNGNPVKLRFSGNIDVPGQNPTKNKITVGLNIGSGQINKLLSEYEYVLGNRDTFVGYASLRTSEDLSPSGFAALDANKGTTIEGKFYGSETSIDLVSGTINMKNPENQFIKELEGTFKADKLP